MDLSCSPSTLQSIQVEFASSCFTVAAFTVTACIIDCIVAPTCTASCSEEDLACTVDSTVGLACITSSVKEPSYSKPTIDFGCSS